MILYFLRSKEGVDGVYSNCKDEDSNESWRKVVEKNRKAH